MGKHVWSDPAGLSNSVRRAVLLSLVCVMVYVGVCVTTVCAQLPANDPLTPIPLPQPVSTAKEYAVDISGASLWVRDTEGAGPVIILLHPYSGSYESWPYQEAAFIGAGYRVISYSRRGHLSSSLRGEQVSDSDDLAALVKKLDIEKFHAVGAAAGGGVAANFAIKQQESLLSLVIVGSILSIQDPVYTELGQTLRPSEFYTLPSYVQELGPSYRAANPNGVKAWLELHDRAWVDHRSPGSDPGNVTWEGLATLKLPVLLITGDADLWTPPVVMRMFAAGIEGSELTVIPEAGHAPAWERPDLFNATVLAFLKSTVSPSEWGRSRDNKSGSPSRGRRGDAGPHR